MCANPKHDKNFISNPKHDKNFISKVRQHQKNYPTRVICKAVIFEKDYSVVP